MLRIIFFAILVAFTACSSITVRKYEPHFKNSEELAKVKENFQDVIVTGANSEMEKLLIANEVACRISPFGLPENESLETYLKTAMKDELTFGKKMSPTGQKLKIIVKQIESISSGIDNTSWDLDFDYEIDKKVITVKNHFENKSEFLSDASCRDTANAMELAIRENFMLFFQKLQKTTK